VCGEEVACQLVRKQGQIFSVKTVIGGAKVVLMGKIVVGGGKDKKKSREKKK